MSTGAIETREAKLRHIKSTVLARSNTTDITNTTGPLTCTGIITGGHGLLKLGIYVTFIPTTAMPTDTTEYTGMVFKIYGWIANANGKYARASETPINGSAGTQIPDGWEGQSTLAMYEVQALLAALNPNSEAGEWTLIVVIEPGDPSMSCDLFDELVERVTVRFDGQVPPKLGLTG